MGSDIELELVEGDDKIVLSVDESVTVEAGGGSVEMQPLTFTGAVEATYDGKTPVTVEIPSSSGGGSEYTRKVTTEEVSEIKFTIPYGAEFFADVIIDVYVPPKEASGKSTIKFGTWSVERTLMSNFSNKGYMHIEVHRNTGAASIAYSGVYAGIETAGGGFTAMAAMGGNEFKLTAPSGVTFPVGTTITYLVKRYTAGGEQ